MKKIITALQNKMVNEKLANQENIKVMTNDIQYQEGIIEALEINRDTDFVLFSELLPGNMKIEELIEKIKQINENIKIIIILENKKEELENYLLAKGKIFVFYNNEITIEELIKIIEEKSNQEIIEQELLEIKKIINQENINLINKTENKKTEKQFSYVISEEDKKEIEKEIEEEFKIKTIFDKIKEIFSKKEKNKIAPIILITGLRGCRKNGIYY